MSSSPENRLSPSDELILKSLMNHPVIREELRGDDNKKLNDATMLVEKHRRIMRDGILGVNMN